MQELVERLAAILKEKGMMMVTAESCTGGGIAHAITSFAGSSEFFAGSVVAYSNELKVRLLDVPVEVLQEYGAVSSQTAQAMAAGAVKATGAAVAISATGIAGPGGGNDKKPAGLVYTGYAINGSPPTSIEHRFQGSRDDVRRQTVEAALNNLTVLLREY